MSQPEPPFKLLPSDLDSATWARLRKHLEDWQLRLRQQLEADREERETAKLRGQLAEVKRLLALGKE